MQNPLATKRKTVDGIMAAFTKTVTDLETVADQSEVDVIDLQAQKAQIETKIESASKEANRARGIVANLTALIGSE